MKIRKIGKKLIICMLIFLMIFNFAIAPAGKLDIVYADNTTTDADEEETNSWVSSLLTGLAGILLTIPRIILVALGQGIQTVEYYLLDSAGHTGSDISQYSLSPYHIFFNKFALTNINIFQVSDVTQGGLVYNIRTTIAALYYVMWCIALGILLVMLIIIGIKMALATLAETKARWKQIFADWVVSAVLVVCMSFIVVGVININNVFVELLSGINIVEGSTDSSEFMTALKDEATSFSSGFIMGWASVLIYFILLLQTAIFGVVYIIRFLKVSILIMISPLMPLTYSIDRANGGHSQVLNSWLKEFCYNVFIQIIHCIIYIAIIAVPMAAISSEAVGWEALAAAVLSIMSIMSVKKLEELLKSILGFDKARSVSSYSSIVNSSQKAIMTGISVANGTYAVTSNLSTGVTNFGSNVQTFGEAASTKIHEAKDNAVNYLTKVESQTKSSSESSEENNVIEAKWSSLDDENKKGSESTTENTTKTQETLQPTYFQFDMASMEGLKKAIASTHHTDTEQVPIYSSDGETIASSVNIPIPNSGQLVDKYGRPISSEPVEESKTESKEEVVETKTSNGTELQDIRKGLRDEFLAKFNDVQKSLLDINNYKKKSKEVRQTKGFNLENAKLILANAQNEKDKGKALETLYIGKEESRSNSERAEYEWALNEFEYKNLISKFENSKGNYVNLVNEALNNKLISDEEANQLKNVNFEESASGTKQMLEIIKPKINSELVQGDVETQSEDKEDMDFVIPESAIDMMRTPTINNAKILAELKGDIQIDGDYFNSNSTQFKVNKKILEKLKQGSYSESNLKAAEAEVKKEGDEAVQRMQNFMDNKNVENARALKTSAEKEYASLVVESKQAGLIIASANMAAKSTYTGNSNLNYNVTEMEVANVTEGVTNGTQGVLESINDRKSTNETINLDSYRTQNNNGVVNLDSYRANSARNNKNRNARRGA